MFTQASPGRFDTKSEPCGRGPLCLLPEKSLAVSSYVTAVDRIDLDGKPLSSFSSVSGGLHLRCNSSVIDVRSGTNSDLDILGTIIAGGAGGTSGIVWSGDDSSVYLGAGQQVYIDGAVFASDLLEVVGGTPGVDDDGLSVLVSTRAGLSSGGQTSDGTSGQVTIQASGNLEIMGHVVGGGTLSQTFDADGDLESQTIDWSDNGGTVTINATGQSYVGGTTINQGGETVQTGGYISAADLIDVTGTSHSLGTATLVHAASELVTRGSDSRINITGTAGDVEVLGTRATGWRNHQGL